MEQDACAVCRLVPIAFVVLAALLAIAMPKLMCRPRESQKPFCTWGAALLFFACYTPMLLIEFPGSFTYDVTAQTFQIANHSMFYPLAHTLLLKFCLDAYGLLQSFEKCALLCKFPRLFAQSGADCGGVFRPLPVSCGVRQQFYQGRAVCGVPRGVRRSCLAGACAARPAGRCWRRCWAWAPIKRWLR